MEQIDFENIATNLRQRIIAVAKGYCLNNEEAEDVAQDTMLKLWTMHERLKKDKTTEALAVTIAKHLAIDNLRRKQPQHLSTCSPDAPADKYAMPDAIIENEENVIWLSKMVKRLPSAEYAVLHLRQVEQKSTAEIAAIVGIKLSSVPTLLARARKKLMEELKRRK